MGVMAKKKRIPRAKKPKQRPVPLPLRGKLLDTILGAK